MPYISIILPIYNVEEYLEKCLDSIFKQKFKDFEVIAVDDGSTDSSFKILESYQSHENRLKIFHKINEGVGEARNFGLEQSIGKYIFFVDPDDSLIPNKLGSLAKITFQYNAELFLFGFEEVNTTGKIVRVVQNKQLTLYKKNEEIGKDFVQLSKENNIRVPWNKLYLRDALIKYSIRFPEQETGEDAVFNLKLLREVCSLVVIDEVFYAYLSGRPGSSQSLFRKIRVSDNLVISNELSKLAEHWNLEKSLIYNNDINNGFKVIKDVFSSKSIKFIFENIRWFRNQKKFIDAFNLIRIKDVGEVKQLVKYLTIKIFLMNCH